MPKEIPRTYQLILTGSEPTVLLNFCAIAVALLKNDIANALMVRHGTANNLANGTVSTEDFNSLEDKITALHNAYVKDNPDVREILLD